MIYIDPPYGISFKSNFEPQLGQRDVKDKVQDLTREPEMVKAYRATPGRWASIPIWPTCATGWRWRANC